MGLVKHSHNVAPKGEQHTAKRDYEGLLDQLGDGRPQVRRLAAKDLVEYPRCVDTLCARLHEESDNTVRDAIFTTLARIGGSAVVDGVVPFLRSDDAELRNCAIDVLKNLPDATAGCIESLIGDADPDVRIFAINVLESLRHPKVEAWLIEVLQNDPHENVCATAIDLLGEVGTPAAIPALRAARTRFESEFTRFACDLALQRIGP